MIRKFERLTEETPILGLWESTFICDLSWSVVGEFADIADTGPSWSWFYRPRQPIFHQVHGRWFERERNKLEPSLESFNVEWSGSPFTSKLVESTLHINGVVRSFNVIKSKWEYGFHVDHPDPSCKGSRAEVECKFDKCSQIREGDHIRCLFLFYCTEHIDTEGPEGGLIYQSSRWEYFLLIAPYQPPPRSALERKNQYKVFSSDEKAAAYRRVGVGRFQHELVPKVEWFGLSGGKHSNISWPNSTLMFEGAERVTFELK
ncbi:uncharacterized protein KY384_007895 [Bacidia gigantensis]|uniref:uncharacterized protein n=1 Tax=Bacidia gigantensis TaxID=2732470 RepID=UPI001D055464|nr:uncharacterized protein KY384_007895 [Bacidia gigantensis]KAG8527741.1 hypothetical protein KY384_007895 [Bacidia gigantensis]